MWVDTEAQSVRGSEGGGSNPSRAMEQQGGKLDLKEARQDERQPLCAVVLVRNFLQMRMSIGEAGKKLSHIG